MNTREQLLLSNIHRLERKLKIKRNPDIRHLGRYKSLQFEIKASKEAALGGPNFIEIVTIIFSTTALLYTMISLAINVKYDTIFRFTMNNDIDSNAENILNAKYIIKEGYDEKLTIFVDILLLFGASCIFIAIWYLLKQAWFIKKLKKHIILEQYLEEYIKIVEKDGREVI